MPPKKSKKKLYLILIGVIIVALIGWKLLKHNDHEYVEFTVEKNDITQTIELSGEVDAALREDLHFLAGGLVTYFPWSEGDEITKFSTIASLDSRILKKTLKKYLNLYSIQRNTFDQTADDNNNSIPTGELGDELNRLLATSQNKLDNSVLDVELQDIALRLSRLYAPFTGILVSSPITTPNVNVSALDNFTLVDPSTLYFLADLDESDLSVIQSGLPVQLELDAFPGHMITTTVDNISYSSKITSTGTTYEVTIFIPENELSKLRLGLNGTASIILSSKNNILTLPIEAITEEVDRTYVLVMDGNKVVEKNIEIGISDNSQVEIVGGLALGDEVMLEK